MTPIRTPITWIVRVFWNVVDQDLMSRLVDQLRANIRGEMFAGDDLITFGKNLSFARDEEFMAAFHSVDPNRVDKAIIWRRHVLAWAARHGLELEGDFVEAGCYDGTAARLVCTLLNFHRQDRRYWLYDTFTHWQSDGNQSGGSAHGPTLEQTVRKRFSDCPNVRIVPGLVPDSLKDGMPEKIALLHIDMNNAEGERAVLQAMYDLLVPGAFIVFDDYGAAANWAQKVSADEFARARGKTILELPTGQGLLIR